ncbi:MULTISPECIES: ATP-binding protein [unclassified Corynebacterium]|uniref:ATP-binding protein n=1 Tax=unclassified Corynebacterium TaxID=2624378 RepID=UPI0029CA8D78|nr:MULTISPECIES: ATP-binding protein [unclassified Corynebacterium]WPF66879.1 ATP-binding protein [Corynebacterium sp. 22KM0430]WPF69367.1 ATP-binding protein [Corynebacterium sp. 21KM1197]
MIPEKNPFRPSFGTSPQELIGRGFELHSFLTGLYEGVGSMNRAVLVSGARGVGKTVLLNEFEEVARGMGWVVVRAYADDSLVNRLVRTTIPQALAALDYGEAAGGVRRMVTGFSLAGIGSISSEVARNRPSPEPSLIGELRALAAAARQHEAGVLVTLDEIQAAHPEQLAHLATAIQDLMRDEYDVAFAAAGLTAGIESLLEHPGTTFMRRANRLELACSMRRRWRRRSPLRPGHTGGLLTARRRSERPRYPRGTHTWFNWRALLVGHAPPWSGQARSPLATWRR